jgi:tetratricopeptide (TPR) repeat protein
VKWLGDGVLTTFTSVADGVRCAVTMAQRTRRPVAGERLGLRVGLHVGEVLHDEGADYVGTPVVLARRLCGRAAAGQILCGSAVVELLRERQGFEFAAVGPLELKGFPEPVAAYEVRYQPDTGAALLRHTPFTGRTAELRRLRRRLEEARTGHGGVVLLAGEPGIGKTRTIEEVAETARAQGALVLWGRCYEGEAAQSFGPFAEALGEYGRTVAPEVLQADLGLHAAPLTRIVPLLRERVPDVPEPVALEPAEERVRLLDAVAQSLLAVAARVPTMLVLDDLHWADAGTVALLRHVARFVPRARLLLLGAYRDVEVAAHHPLTDALGTLPRETSYEQLGLAGLDAAAIKELVDTVADREMPAAWVEALTRETSGNPFFLREVLLHLAEEGVLAPADGRAAPGPEGLQLPDTVRQVIARRLARLPAATSDLLRVAAVFTGGIDFEVARRVAGLEEHAALDALDAALAAQLLAAAGGPTAAYDFPHALVRHTLYEGLSPARQVRLHRAVAEAMEAIYGERAVEHAAEIASQYARSAGLPGSERGVPHAVAAADRAAAASAHDDTVTFLRIALQLLPPNDARRARLLGRLGMALLGALNYEAALPAVREAGELIAAAEGKDAAADFLAEAAMQCTYGGGFYQGAWAFASQGLGYIGDRRDLTWVRLMIQDITRRECEDPNNSGIVFDTPERRAVLQITERLSFSWSEEVILAPGGFLPLKSRQDILSRHSDSPHVLMWGAGEFRRSLRLWEDLEAQSQREGRIRDAVMHAACAAICHNALGNLAAARAAYDRGAALARRVTGAFLPILNGAQFDMVTVVGDGWEALGSHENVLSRATSQAKWLLTTAQAGTAQMFAWFGMTDESLSWLETFLPALERVPAWAFGCMHMACGGATTLWLLQRTDHIEVIARNVHDKVLVPDFRWTMYDGRLSMARLCALQGHYDEARDWFAKARTVLDEQGARPLRAIVDFDEALMYCRRGARGDMESAPPLLEAALQQFHALGMTGWIRRAVELRTSSLTDQRAPSVQRGAESDKVANAADTPISTAPGYTPSAGGVARLHHEGDYWTVEYADTTSRLRDMKGLCYLAYLLRDPGREFHALDLMRVQMQRDGFGTPVDPGLEVLDPQAKTAYRQRLEELRADLEEAEAFNDTGRAARAREEMEAIGEQLAAAVGLRGRDRLSGSAAERARTTVTHRLRAVIRRIAQDHPGLGDHLGTRVRTGTFCSYQPDRERPIVWAVSENTGV